MIVSTIPFTRLDAGNPLAAAYLTSGRRDRKEATRWLRRSARAGYAPAQYALASLYFRRKDGPGSSRSATRWLEQAALQGDSYAQLALGYRYTAGHGVRRSPKQAIKWYRMAAELGSAEAQEGLGLLYEKGEGVPQDYVQAYVWYELSTRHGKVETRTQRRDALAKKMTHEQIAEAQMLAKGILESIQKNRPARRPVGQQERPPVRPPVRNLEPVRPPPPSGATIPQ